MILYYKHERAYNVECIEITNEQIPNVTVHNKNKLRVVHNKTKQTPQQHYRNPNEYISKQNTHKKLPLNQQIIQPKQNSTETKSSGRKPTRTKAPAKQKTTTATDEKIPAENRRGARFIEQVGQRKGSQFCGGASFHAAKSLYHII